MPRLCLRWKTFGPNEISAQIHGADDANTDGWILWNPHNHYSDIGLTINLTSKAEALSTETFGEGSPAIRADPKPVLMCIPARRKRQTPRVRDASPPCPSLSKCTRRRALDFISSKITADQVQAGHSRPSTICRVAAPSAARSSLMPLRLAAKYNLQSKPAATSLG